MVIEFMVINGYSISGYLVVILLLAITSYSINGYQWNCFINGYWWIFYVQLSQDIGGYWWLFFVILSYITSIGGYYIINYCWIF